MKKLQLPSSYAALSPEEQCAAFGGSEFGDAVGSFFDNLHFNDFFWNGGLISFSFTFVPMLLFRVIEDRCADRDQALSADRPPAWHHPRGYRHCRPVLG